MGFFRLGKSHKLSILRKEAKVNNLANFAKQKGNCFEYDCQHNLAKIMPDIYRTAERGYQRQYDLQSDEWRVVFECKRLKGISWNELVKLYTKLKSSAPVGYGCAVLFQSNRQPALMFDGVGIVPISQEYSINLWEKHPSTRKRRDSSRNL